jgi:hypothetical protein
MADTPAANIINRLSAQLLAAMDDLHVLRATLTGDTAASRIADLEAENTHLRLLLAEATRTTTIDDTAFASSPAGRLYALPTPGNPDA